ncbi:unnamed protein product [Didymodactylos carnosus]|uniref:Uncharacterized protein n=1 Tax=Didymodactylos carnosus TaxID=1234261 RepID=A0A815M0J0_9BILA|nr:unnamed protein product [Didymodactylos carnosus]CAF1671402.1 unnamed protein product [Didymodactylos carnosus]CAF4302835.1 unnamed protein product [Didymodactylos carnosus]CAF4546196.1 unnamed protein product [Didymodactylos carnosus]
MMIDDRIDDDDPETDENNLHDNTENIVNSLANDSSVNLLRIRGGRWTRIVARPREESRGGEEFLKT